MSGPTPNPGLLGRVAGAAGHRPRRGSATPASDPAVAELEAERAIVVARLVGAAFAVYMVATYAAEPYPPGVEAAGYALAALLAVSCLPVVIALRRISTLRTARTLSMATLALDAVVLVAFVWLYAFDDGSVHFLLFFVLPAEAALKLGLLGAVGAWLVSTAGYLGRAVFASEQYGYAINLPSISFRMGILLLVSLVMGLFAQRMSRHARDLRQVLERLEAEERWRTALIDMLAHDLRSPIGTAASALQLLQQGDGALDEEQRPELVGSALRQNQQALSLTDDLLELARARQGRLELHRARVDLPAELDRAIGEVSESDDDWVSVEVEGTGTAHLDPARLHQILVNLLSNARKHGRPPVTVSARVEQDETIIRVTDRGEGPPEDHQDLMFKPLGGGPRSDSVGLGLWIVHTLALAHGGGASYTTRDGLPTFVVHLPHADTPEVELPDV